MTPSLTVTPQKNCFLLPFSCHLAAYLLQIPYCTFHVKVNFCAEIFLHPPLNLIVQLLWRHGLTVCQKVIVDKNNLLALLLFSRINKGAEHTLIVVKVSEK